MNVIYGPCNYIAVKAMNAVELVSGFGGVLFFNRLGLHFFPGLLSLLIVHS